MQKNCFRFLTATFFMLQAVPATGYADQLLPLNPDLTKQTWANYLSPDGTLALFYYWDASTSGTYLWTSTGGISTFPTYNGYDLSVDYASLNKSIFAGTYSDGSNTHAFLLQNSVVTDLGGPAGSYNTVGLSNDGGKVAGTYQDVSNYNHAFYYDGSMHIIDAPGATHTYAYGLSADGSTLLLNAFGASHGFTWKNGTFTQLEEMTPTSTVTPQAISADGSVVVGYQQDYSNGGISHAGRWTNGVFQDIGDLVPGFGTYATLVSSDGNVLAGQSNTSASTAESFVWKNGTMTSLGTVANSYSFPMAMKNDGTVVAGFNEDNVSYTDAPYYWTSAGGMKTFAQILTDRGVDLTGWDLNNYADMYMSADGKTILTTGLYNGDAQVYLFTPQGGLITPQELQTSLMPATAPAQQVQASVNGNFSQSIFVARNALSVYLKPPAPPAPAFLASNDAAKTASLQDIAPAAGGDDIVALPLSQPAAAQWRHATYATGGFGSSLGGSEQQLTGNATAGVITQVAQNTAVGVGVMASADRQDTHLGGDSSTRAGGVSVMAAHEDPSGWNAYATLSGAALDITSKRNYLNGASVDSSKGDTNGYVVSAAVKTGYEMRVHEKATVMPYVQVDAAHSVIDGYSETGGAFPAIVSDRSDNYLATRTGVEISHDVGPGLTVRGQTAWGHRLSDMGSVVASAGGVTVTVPDNDSGRDWAEFGLGLNKQLGDRAILAADLAARAGSTSEPDIGVTLGLVWNWN